MSSDPYPRSVPTDPAVQMEWLRQFIAEETPEDDTLDYKHGNSLNNVFKSHFKGTPQVAKTCGCGASKGKSPEAIKEEARIELSKDVSGFANAEGGLLIYGISEGKASGGGRSVPEKFAPVDASINPEDISQLLNAHITPKINGIKVTVIKLTEEDHSGGGCCVVIAVPKSSTAHQAQNKLYYRRWGTEMRDLRDGEIREVMNRVTHPDVHCELFVKSAPMPGEGIPNTGRIYIEIVNKAPVFCKFYYFRIVIPLMYGDCLVSIDNPHGKASTPYGKGWWRTFKGENLFPGERRHVLITYNLEDGFEVSQSSENKQSLSYKVVIEIFADSMPRKLELFDMQEAMTRWMDCHEGFLRSEIQILE